VIIFTEDKRIYFHEDGESTGLPKGEKEDRFDTHELREGIEGLQSLLCRHVKEHQTVEG